MATMKELCPKLGEGWAYVRTERRTEAQGPYFLHFCSLSPRPPPRCGGCVSGRTGSGARVGCPWDAQLGGGWSEPWRGCSMVHPLS